MSLRTSIQRQRMTAQSGKHHPYRKLAWLKTDGYAYVKLKFTSNDVNEIDIEFNQVNSSIAGAHNAICGTYSGEKFNGIGLYARNNSTILYAWNSMNNTRSIANSPTGYHHAVINGNGLIYDSIRYPLPTRYGIAVNDNLYLFGTDDAAYHTVRYPVTIISLKINGYSIIPCTNEDGDVGVYDEYHDSFEPLLGTGTYEYEYE